MYDFRDIHATSKSEQIRAWAVEQALEMPVANTIDILITRAKKIEDYVKGEVKGEVKDD